MYFITFLHRQVFEDYDCMLNQTNIGHNNNKYYVIQVLKRAGINQYHAWNRWGRVVSVRDNEPLCDGCVVGVSDI